MINVLNVFPFQETRVTSLRDILERGVRDGRLKPENLKILDDLEVR